MTEHNDKRSYRDATISTGDSDRTKDGQYFNLNGHVKMKSDRPPIGATHSKIGISGDSHTPSEPLHNTGPTRNAGGGVDLFRVRQKTQNKTFLR